MTLQNNGDTWSRQRRDQRLTSFQDLRVTYEGHSEEISTRPPDLSPRGMFINTSRNFPEGSVLNIHFRLVRSKVEINTRCEVRYCLAGVGVGVEFVGISADAVRAIEQELDAGLNRQLMAR
jgi:hypothetical protein